MTYQQARDDYTYLWSTYGRYMCIKSGYMDRHDFELLMESPSKATAMKRYVNQIRYWFEVGPEPYCIDFEWRTDARVEDIARSHGSQYILQDLRDRLPGQQKDT